MSQRTLFSPPPADGKLGPRQQAVIDLLRAAPEGLTDDEVGVHLHGTVECRHCAPDRPCRYARGDGHAVLKSLRGRGLTRYRRKTGRWHATSRVVHPLDDIPY